MLGNTLLCLLQLLADGLPLLLFQRNSGIFLECRRHNIHIFCLEKDQIFGLALFFCLFQTIINAVLPSYPVKRLDVIVCDNDIGKLCAALLQALDAGYKIKVLNTINFKKSMHYNPFHYIRSEKDILKLVNTIIANTKGDGEKSGEDFWVKAERLLYCALIGYIYYEAPEEEQNFSTLLEFINASEAREDDEEFKNPVDELFEDLEKAKPEHFAVRQYKKYKLAAGDICSK
jgi:hypothetical protein